MSVRTINIWDFFIALSFILLCFISSFLPLTFSVFSRPLRRVAGKWERETLKLCTKLCTKTHTYIANIRYNNEFFSSAVAVRLLFFLCWWVSCRSNVYVCVNDVHLLCIEQTFNTHLNIHLCLFSLFLLRLVFLYDLMVPSLVSLSLRRDVMGGYLLFSGENILWWIYESILIVNIKFKLVYWYGRCFD